MATHTFAICAYQDSPYLESCIRSLKRQTIPAKIILCTSTPSPFLRGLSEKYQVPLYIREGKSDIQADWNFAFEMAKGRLVTIAHQDDCYHREYARHVQECWDKYPDTMVFTTSCVIIKNGRVQRPGTVEGVKCLLRLPLRLHCLAGFTWIKRGALAWGNPVVCPSCTYDREAVGTPLFQSPFKFVLDWDTLWRLAAKPGRFICVEKPLIGYRIHQGATTKAFIDNHGRYEEEVAMYRKIWPGWMARCLMAFYQKAYGAYGDCQRPCTEKGKTHTKERHGLEARAYRRKK